MKPPPPSIVSPLWPGSTVCCAGSGPSLTASDLEYARDHGARVIAVNDAYRLALWADAMYAADQKFWRWKKGAPEFPGLKFAIQPQAAAWPGVQVVRNAGRRGLSLDPAKGICTGHNSGYQAVNLAVQLGAKRIILLGFDMHGDHFFGSHPDKTRPPFQACLSAFESLVEPLKEAGVSIVNCAPGSALRCFPMAPLRTVLAEAA